jgi:hypothetical protein
MLKATGDISLNADVTAKGESAAALIGSLNGKGAGEGSKIVFSGFDLARMSRLMMQPNSTNLTDMLNTSMGGVGTTSFDTLATAFDIKNGIIDISDLTLKGKDATVTSPGTVNLPLWTIDMESDIKLAEPANAPPLKVAFRGPLDNPSQTFGKSALDAYVGTALGGKINNLIDKKLGGNAALKNLLGLPQQATPAAGGAGDGGGADANGGGAAAVIPDTAGVPATPTTAPADNAAAPAPAEAPAQPPKKVKAKDVFNSILQNAIQGR